MENIDWKSAAECMRVLSHPHRLKIIGLLLERDYSVSELAKECHTLQNVMSEHLKIMRLQRFIKSYRNGRNVFYSIHEPMLSSIISCIEKRFKK